MDFSLPEIRQAILDEQFIMLYQPLVRLDTGKVVAAEALARWRLHGGALVSPDRFIPQIEANGFTDSFTKMVIRLVVRDYEIVRAHGFNIHMGINISAVDLAKGDFIPAFIQALEDYRCEAEAFTFEVTESTVVDDYKACMGNLSLLHGLGCRVSIDDFGTGHASLKYVRHFPANEIKIDQQYVAGMLTSGLDRVIVEFVIALSHKLHCSTVAEGVENEATALALAELGCDIGQGYHFSRPISIYDLVEFINAHH